MQRILKVFIASPYDVSDERKMAQKAIEEVSLRLVNIYDVLLTPVSWTDFAPIASPRPGVSVQEPINERLEDCCIFIGILGERYGTRIDEMGGESGTEAEFRIAIQNRHRIRMLTYFRRPQLSLVDASPEKVEQRYRLQVLKDHLTKEHIAHHEHTDPAEFEKRIVLDLFELALEIITKADQRRRLSSFFKLGRRPGDNDRSVLLAYPAIHKHQPTSGITGSYNWRKRLLPNVVFEDFKAIQKLEVALRSIGVQNVSSVTDDSPRLMERGNRIWLCIPRNRRGQQELGAFRENCCFTFENQDDPEQRTIKWTPPGRDVTIRSPLGLYLQLRPRDHTQWRSTFACQKVVDFAVLARFRLDEDPHADQNEPFYQYFIAGIRGLGTWGAGWFIDRKPRDLEALVKSGSDCAVQAILKVTYQDFHIHDVENVSDKDQSYFDGIMDEARDYVAKQVKHAHKKTASR